MAETISKTYFHLLVKTGILRPKDYYDNMSELEKLRWAEIVDFLVSKQMATEQEIAHRIANYYKRPFMILSEQSLDVELVRNLTEEYCSRNLCILLENNDDECLLAVSNPLELDIVQEIEHKFHKKVVLVIACVSDIKNAIKQYFNIENVIEGAIEALEKEEAVVIPTKETASFINVAQFQENDVKPVARIVNLILTHAIEQGASDIHIEPLKLHLRIRIRVDGVLRQAAINKILTKKTSLEEVVRCIPQSSTKIDKQ